MRSGWLRRIQRERMYMSSLSEPSKTISVSPPPSIAFVLIFTYFMVLTFCAFFFFYTGPDIWLEYAQYSIGGMGSPGGMDKVRSIFERAVTAVGLHMTKGQMLWEAYREFENAILSTVQVCVSISWKNPLSCQRCTQFLEMLIFGSQKKDARRLCPVKK